ncbi:eukaryotic translation initiation factor 2-alpha kinase-like [Trichoplusia ni]|uniref:non-specific serine/threonine protein kinase n=1 Tax=Trichoplusia ni TaxID=7111 RepID=A0A7E5X1A6_TRINI|nr:eukaryotic translation initiation factor 2-alpha kinase-like [Trichoplusia ni]
MSDWYWRVIALKAAFALSFIVCSLRADDTVQKLPFCNPNNVKDGPVHNDLVIVSTLDGRLTAFSTQNGLKAWDLETQPLLSSNLHHVELTSGGKWVRLVPSLSGSLYSLSGDNIEPLPFDADQLLSSSFKYSDDLVIAGARETLWFGLDAHTGGVIYECGSGGCSTEQQTANADRDVIVLRRHSSTVRALDPRSGSEKWNFSVAEHRVALSRRECAEAGAGAAPLGVAVALPEGVVAVRDVAGSKLWQQKLESPVAGIWRLYSGTLQHIDVLWEATQTLANGGLTQQPSLYIGVHDKQLYIQESEFYTRKLETAVSAKPLPWKLVTARPQLTAEPEDERALSLHDTDKNALSLITLYGSAGNNIGDHGYFVYLEDTCDQSVQVSEDLFDDTALPNISAEEPEHHHIHVHISSLWYWWKEVLLIAVSSALLMNLMIWPRFFAPKIRAQTPLPIVSQEQVVVQVCGWHPDQPGPRPNIPEYSGRYENDFTPLRCLGRGGFGVVFEAKNNIDHCSYAVKRITLPRRESKRERVLREVRALAKLDHEHIVRYFNAWVEEPPPLWQKQRDEVWMRELDAPASDVMLNLKSSDLSFDALEFKKDEPSKRIRSFSCDDSFSIVFDENAPSSDKTPTNDVTYSKTNDVTHSRTNDVSHSKPDDDSFIVFAHSETESKRNSFDKRLERVKECDYKTESSTTGRKKKLGPSPAGPHPQMYLYIQMQLCRRDSLHDWLRDNRKCDARADKVKILFSQIVSAVEYVHLAGLIHRDLKPSNILFAPDGRVKVGDFGLVTAMNDTSNDGEEKTDAVDPHQRHTYRVGTHLYMSPEQLLGRPYSYKVDIYSLGLILFELLQPFATEAERVACLLRLRNSLYPEQFTQSYPQETEVLKLMLSEDPSQRPTATGVRARAPLFQLTNPEHHFILPAMAAA